MTSSCVICSVCAWGLGRWWACRRVPGMYGALEGIPLMGGSFWEGLRFWVSIRRDLKVTDLTSLQLRGNHQGVMGSLLSSFYMACRILRPHLPLPRLDHTREILSSLRLWREPSCWALGHCQLGSLFQNSLGEAPLLGLTLWSVTQKTTWGFKAVRVPRDPGVGCCTPEAGEAFISKLAQLALVSTEVTIYRAQCWHREAKRWFLQLTLYKGVQFSWHLSDWWY